MTASAPLSTVKLPSVARSGAKRTPTRPPGSSLRGTDASPCRPAEVATSLTRHQRSTRAQATKKSLRRNTKPRASPYSSQSSSPLPSPELLAGTSTITGAPISARSASARLPLRHLTANSPGSSTPSLLCRPSPPWSRPCPCSSAASGAPLRARMRGSAAAAAAVTGAGSRARRAGLQRVIASPAIAARTRPLSTTRVSFSGRTATRTHDVYYDALTVPCFFARFLETATHTFFFTSKLSYVLICVFFIFPSVSQKT